MRGRWSSGIPAPRQHLPHRLGRGGGDAARPAQPYEDHAFRVVVGQPVRPVHGERGPAHPRPCPARSPCATGDRRTARRLLHVRAQLRSDISATTTKAIRDGDHYLIDGQKMWLTNGGSSSLVSVLVKTDQGADSVYWNMTTFLVEKTPGFGEVEPASPSPARSRKMGYKGVDTTELLFSTYRTPADKILGAATGRGFYQMMNGVEVGRVNVAALGCGLALRAFELAVGYAQQRQTSASRSPAIRRCCSGSRTWPPGSRPRARPLGRNGRTRSARYGP